MYLTGLVLALNKLLYGAESLQGKSNRYEPVFSLLHFPLFKHDLWIIANQLGYQDKLDLTDQLDYNMPHDRTYRPWPRAIAH